MLTPIIIIVSKYNYNYYALGHVKVFVFEILQEVFVFEILLLTTYLYL